VYNTRFARRFTARNRPNGRSVYQFYSDDICDLGNDANSGLPLNEIPAGQSLVS
jgi:hypothetical protein